MGEVGQRPGFLKKFFFFICKYLCTRVCSCECSPCGDQQRELEPLVLELQVLVSNLKFTLGIEIRTSAEAAHAPNY